VSQRHTPTQRPTPAARERTGGWLGVLEGGLDAVGTFGARSSSDPAARRGGPTWTSPKGSFLNPGGHRGGSFWKLF
jgi:hypothetical protein